MQYSKTDFLMGTDITITINSNVNPMDDIFNSFSIFYSLEKEFSRFLNDSELSLLNNSREREVSNRFIEIFNISKRLYEDTNYYFNPLVNLCNLGYSRDFSEGVFEKTDFLQNLDLNSVVVLGNFISLKSGQNLDFGGVVKGYAVDIVFRYLKDKRYSDFIINAGGDIYISGKNKNGKTPVVAIDSPFKDDEVFATIELENKAISTSGTYKRNWTIENKGYHHILNPYTNENNNEIISISIIHDSCYLADAYATTCIAMGIEKSLDFLKEKNVDGVIIGSDGKVYKTRGMEKYCFNVL